MMMGTQMMVSTQIGDVKIHATNVEELCEAYDYYKEYMMPVDLKEEKLSFEYQAEYEFSLEKEEVLVGKTRSLIANYQETIDILEKMIFEQEVMIRECQAAIAKLNNHPKEPPF